MRETFLVFGQPMIEEAEINEVLDSLRTAWLGTGPKVARFERDFATCEGSVFSIALNLKRGDEVITTPMTSCATVNAVIHAGGTPVLADVDPDTMNIDPVQVEKRVTSKTRVLLPVHVAGRPSSIDRIMSIARRYDLAVVEDCAHAIETRYKGQEAGTIGDFGCVSFYSTKSVVTGEGGMLLAKSSTSRPDASMASATSASAPRSRGRCARGSHSARTRA
jgi:dTDP-4-amino-4,6-dideoxygalactose transaminase